MENTPVENTARTLFKETEMDPAQTEPLSTITNINTKDVNTEDQEEVLSPSLQNVSQLKNWIINMERENRQKSDSAWKKPTVTLGSRPYNNNSRQSSGKVKEMKEKLIERKQMPPRGAKTTTSTPATTLPSRNVKIPMNKVQEMKQILLDYKQNQAKEKEVIHMSSKKRAKIAERLNHVEDIQKWLAEMERQGKKNNSSNVNASMPKTKELNLPMNRVREMKNWLIEFERQNKEHNNRFATKGTTPFTNSRKRTNSDTPSKTAGLAQFLVDFEHKNKEHFEKSQKKGALTADTHPDEIVDTNPNTEEEKDECTTEETASELDFFNAEGYDSEHFVTEDQNEESSGKETGNEKEEGEEEKEEEEDDAIEDLIVENTSILDTEPTLRDMNTSMMPTTNNLDQSQWEDDYDDLLKVNIHIEPVQSVDSWENESFAHSNVEKSSDDQNVVGEDEVKEVNDEDLLPNDNEEVSASSCNDDQGTSSHQGEDDALDTSSVQQDTENLFADYSMMQTEDNNLTQTYDRAEENQEETDLSQNFESEGRESELIGEHLLSTSHAGARFSSSFILPADNASLVTAKNNTTVVVTTEKVNAEPVETNHVDESEYKSTSSSKGGLGCVYKSLFRIFVPKKKDNKMKDEEAHENNVRMSEQLLATQEGIAMDYDAVEVQVGNNAKSYHNSLNLSPDSKSHYNEDGGYLPYAYNGVRGEPQDFARDMLLGRTNSHFDVTAESPVSLASKFRRNLSPTASSTTGSELSCVQTLINGQHNNTNVAQHVGWLQGHFQSPKSFGETRKGESMY
jgi:hypothetical protein